MKKRNIWLTVGLMAGCVWTSCTTEPSVAENEFLIEGTLENVEDSVVLRLADYEFEHTLLDTVIGGKFHFRDTITGDARQMLLSTTGNAQGFPGTYATVWVAPGEKITVKGTDKLLQTWDIQSRLPEQQEENALNAAGFPEREAYLRYLADEYDWFRQMFILHAGDAEFERQGWKQVDSIRALYEPLDSLIQVKELAYLGKAPVGKPWLEHYRMFATRLQWDPDYAHNDQIRALFSRLSEADKQTKIGKEITQYMNLPKAVNVGDEMADGDLYDTEGNVHHLSELKGKYLLLDFWSSGCGPCIASIPELKEIGELYKDRLVVVSISEDSEEQWKNALQTHQMEGIQWNELRDGRTGLFAAYQVRMIPHYVLISPDGKVQTTWSGYSEGTLKKKIMELLIE